MSISSIISRLRNTQSINEKKKILEDNKEDNYFKLVLKYCYDPFITFGVNKSISFRNATTRQENYEEYLFELLEKLHKRALTGNAAREAIVSFGSKYSRDIQDLILRILNKDLQCGISIKTINKVFKGLVPVFELQLCNTYRDKELQYPVYCEPKLDGARLVICRTASDDIIMRSRNGLEKDFPYLLKDAKKLIPKGFAIDGELINEQGFQASMTQFNRKYNKSAKGQKLFIFDIIPEHKVVKSIYKEPLRERRAFLEKLYSNNRYEYFVLSAIQTISNKQQLDVFYRSCLDQQYEGIIIKEPDSYYEAGRNNNWLKLKPTDTADCEVVKVIEGKNSLKGKLGSVIVKMPNGNRSRVSGFRLDERIRFWNNPNLILGKIIEVKYDRLTEEGKFRFARFVKIREDK